MLEAEPPVDPDEPNAFIQHYKSGWEREGFTPTTHEHYSRSSPSEAWIWREGIFSVEVTHDTSDPAHGPAPFGAGGGFDIYGFINNVAGDVEAKSQSAYAHKTAKTEAKALAVATQLKNDISNSMAARLSRLGFVGWRNHWHKAPINVTLKPSKAGGYANIKVDMDYVPNADVIRVLTGLDKMCSKLYPDR